MSRRPRLLLSSAQWRRIEPYIKGRDHDPGVTGRNNRRFVEGVLWILRTGSPWRDLPGYFGRWNTTYQRFRRWCLRSVWGRILQQLSKGEDAGEALLLDSTVIRAHQHSTNGCGQRSLRAIGRSRGGLSTKLHVIVTPAWRVRAHAFTAGQTADVKAAVRLLRQLPCGFDSLIADRAYDSDAFVDKVRRRGIAEVIPARRGRLHPRSWSREGYRIRHGVENYFARLKHFRRIATRFDRRVPLLRGFFLLANIAILVGVTVGRPN